VPLRQKFINNPGKIKNQNKKNNQECQAKINLNGIAAEMRVKNQRCGAHFR
jgi:hypothetical protein